LQLGAALALAAMPPSSSDEKAIRHKVFNISISMLVSPIQRILTGIAL
jgi:hypothetical protein